MATDERITGAWLLRKPMVHDIALTLGTGPRLHHIGMWVGEPGGVLRACDQLAAAGVSDAIERGPGRHGVSNAFFVYLRDPDGHRIELYSCDYYTGDPDHAPLRWSVSDPRCRSFWGAGAPDSWYEESSVLLDPDGELVATRGRPRRAAGAHTGHGLVLATNHPTRHGGSRENRQTRGSRKNETETMSDLYLVFSEPPADLPDTVYQRWYAEHLRENLETPGFDAGQRFAPSHTVAGTNERFSHLAAYECHGDIADLRRNLAARRNSGAIVLPDWFDQIRFSSWHCTALEERVVAPEV